MLATAPPTPDHREQEITLRTSLARVLMSTKGYTMEAEETASRALELAEEEGTSLELFPVLRALASLYNFRADYAAGDLDKGFETSRKLLDVAERHDDPSMLVDAHLLVGSSVIFTDVETGLEHLDAAIEHMDPESDMARRFRFGPYPGVPTLTTSAFFLWMRGESDRARERTDRALSIAAELEHPITLAYARYHVGYFHVLWEEPEVALELAPRVREVAREYDLTLWNALSDCLDGAAKTWTGRRQEGLEQLESGLAVYEGLTTPPIFWPFLLWLKAGALGAAGRPGEGVEAFDHAMSTAGVDPSMDLPLVAELSLTKGDLLFAGGEERAASAWFERALEVATQLELRMPRLRAATRLCRLRRGEEGEDEAVRLLQSVYDSFGEGSSAVPLVEAENLLDELA